MIEDPSLLPSRILGLNSTSSALSAMRRDSAVRRRSIPDICTAVAGIERQIEAIHAPQALLDVLAAQQISTQPDAVAVARLALCVTEIDGSGLFMQHGVDWLFFRVAGWLARG